MFYEFLILRRTEILLLAESKCMKLAATRSKSEKLNIALSDFFNHLIDYLKKKNNITAAKSITLDASRHGVELYKLNYSVSQVVHTYGSMCQAITEIASQENFQIDAVEFNDLNMCLDYAIASAVSSFQHGLVDANEELELQHLGFLVHELRNSLSNATIAHEMIKLGIVGASGNTARILEDNLARMRQLIDRSLSDIRLRVDPEVRPSTFDLEELFNQVVLTAQSELRKKNQSSIIEVDSTTTLTTDRHLLISAVSNLFQNAMKHSSSNSQITIRSKLENVSCVIEIEDQGVGVSPELKLSLFKPFVKTGANKSGLGLGLTIAKRAVLLLGGDITIRDASVAGSIFQIKIPIKYEKGSRTPVTLGKNAIHPFPESKE